MLAYQPNTPNGMGLLVPILKIAVRPLYILGAIHNEWPMTLEQAQAEINDALQRYRDIDFIHVGEALSQEARISIEEWAEHLNTIRNSIATAITENDLDTNVSDTLAPNVSEFARMSWALMSVLDKELVGMRDDQTDPGQLP